MSGTELPITGSEQPDSRSREELEIAELVDRFYMAAREDPELGPVFEKNVADWDKHLSTMRDFWSSAVYRTGRYSGRPLDVHRRIPEIQAEHFPRWLSLWQRTVDEVVSSEASWALKEFAARMASAMPMRMGLNAMIDSGE